MSIYKLFPAIKRPIWSGHNLQKFKTGCEGKIGETWELSFIDGSQSQIEGQPIDSIIKKEEWGSVCEKLDKFPLLIKLIDAGEKLSVQVHPDSEYAKKHSLIDGKTETWYVLDAKQGAGLYLGFNRKTCPEEVERMAKDGTIESILNFIPVKRGDCYFVKSGTIHAIGKDVTIVEVQQSSDVTFRVYDYNRIDANGNKRELHLNDSLRVLDYESFKKVEFSSQLGSLQTDCNVKKLSQCEYFTLYECEENGSFYSKNSFVAIVCIEGTGKIGDVKIGKGETVFVSANTKFEVSGKIKYLLTGVGI